jgi:hypothetical protein
MRGVLPRLEQQFPVIRAGIKAAEAASKRYLSKEQYEKNDRIGRVVEMAFYKGLLPSSTRRILQRLVSKTKLIFELNGVQNIGVTSFEDFLRTILILQKMVEEE